MAFTMACPNLKKGLKMAFGPLGIIIFEASIYFSFGIILNVVKNGPLQHYTTSFHFC